MACWLTPCQIESHLGTLDLFKTLTLNAPNDAIAKMMQTTERGVGATRRRALEAASPRAGRIGQADADKLNR